MTTRPRSWAGRWWSSAADPGPGARSRPWSPTHEGRAVVDATMFRRAADNVFRASYAGDVDSASDQTGPVPVALVRRSSKVTVGGPDSVVDEQSVRVSVRWQTGNGLPVNGIVRLQRRNGGGDWRLVRRLRTGADGRAQMTARPRVDTSWRAQVRRLDWVFGDTSGVHRINNLPPGVPVRLPSAAPRPRINLPDQRHAVGAGPNANISADPRGRLEPDDRTHLAPRLPGRPVRPALPADQLLGLPRLPPSRRAGRPRDGGRQDGRCAGRDVPQEAADPRDVPRRPLRLVQPGARGRRLQVDGRGQHLGLQLSRRRRPSRGAVTALLRALAGPEHLGEPLPLRSRAPSPTPGGWGTRTPGWRGAPARTRSSS